MFGDLVINDCVVESVSLHTQRRAAAFTVGRHVRDGCWPIQNRLHPSSAVEWLVCIGICHGGRTNSRTPHRLLHSTFCFEASVSFVHINALTANTKANKSSMLYCQPVHMNALPLPSPPACQGWASSFVIKCVLSFMAICMLFMMPISRLTKFVLNTYFCDINEDNS